MGEKCYARQAAEESPSLFRDGELVFQAHHVGWIVSGFFALVAVGVSIWLIGKHLVWYTNKRQQRQIVRLLFMVPIYAIISCLAYFFWEHALPFILIRDCYEAVILTAFFYLLLEYLGPTVAEQREVFRHLDMTKFKWVFPFGSVKSRPADGLYFLQLMKWGVLQYAVLRPATTLASVILDFMGLYCEDSWSFKWGHVYMIIIVSISVTVAMYCLIQLYMPVSENLAPYKPILKLFSVKAIIGLMFWQSALLSLLAMLNVVKDTRYMTGNEINIGFAALLQTFEMMCFAFLHVYCFSYKPYRKSDPALQTKRMSSLKHALDFRDYWRETQAGGVYMWKKARGKEADPDAKRRTHFERAMGRGRSLLPVEPKTTEKPDKVEDSPDEVDADEHDRLFRGRTTDPLGRSWLHVDVEHSGSRRFSSEVGDELERRGYSHKREGPPLSSDDEDDAPGHQRGQRSWWRGVYDRLTTHDGKNRNADRSRSRNRSSRYPDLEDAPPRSSLKGRKGTHKRQRADHDADEAGQPSARLLAPIDPRPLRERLNEAERTSPAKAKNNLLAPPQPSSPVSRSDTMLGRMFRSEAGHDVTSQETHDRITSSVHGPLVSIALGEQAQKLLPPVPQTSRPSTPLSPPPPPKITTQTLSRVISQSPVITSAPPFPQPSHREVETPILTHPIASSSSPMSRMPEPMTAPSQVIGPTPVPHRALARQQTEALTSAAPSFPLPSQRNSGLYSQQTISPPQHYQGPAEVGRSRPRPKIVLPAPLSPARFPDGQGQPLSLTIPGSDPVPRPLPGDLFDSPHPREYRPHQVSPRARDSGQPWSPQHYSRQYGSPGGYDNSPRYGRPQQPAFQFPVPRQPADGYSHSSRYYQDERSRFSGQPRYPQNASRYDDFGGRLAVEVDVLSDTESLPRHPDIRRATHGRRESVPVSNRQDHPSTFGSRPDGRSRRRSAPLDQAIGTFGVGASSTSPIRPVSNSPPEIPSPILARDSRYPSPGLNLRTPPQRPSHYSRIPATGVNTAVPPAQDRTRPSTPDHESSTIPLTTFTNPHSPTSPVSPNHRKLVRPPRDAGGKRR